MRLAYVKELTAVRSGSAHEASVQAGSAQVQFGFTLSPLRTPAASQGHRVPASYGEQPLSIGGIHCYAEQADR